MDVLAACPENRYPELGSAYGVNLRVSGLSTAWSMNCSCILDTPAIHGGRIPAMYLRRVQHGSTSQRGPGNGVKTRGLTASNISNSEQ